jgi:hypothetical protein
LAAVLAFVQGINDGTTRASSLRDGQKGLNPSLCGHYSIRRTGTSTSFEQSHQAFWNVGACCSNLVNQAPDHPGSLKSKKK